MSCAPTPEKVFRDHVESRKCVLLQTDVPVAEHQDRSMEHKTHRKHQQSCHALTETSNLCRNSTHRRLPSKPLIERCSVSQSFLAWQHEHPGLEQCCCSSCAVANCPPTSTYLLPSLQLSPSRLAPSLPHTAMPTSFDPQPPRFNVDGDQFSQRASYLPASVF